MTSSDTNSKAMFISSVTLHASDKAADSAKYFTIAQMWEETYGGAESHPTILVIRSCEV